MQCNKESSFVWLGNSIFIVEWKIFYNSNDVRLFSLSISSFVHFFVVILCCNNESTTYGEEEFEKLYRKMENFCCHIRFDWMERERPQCDNKNNVKDIRWSHREGRKCCSLNDDSPPFSPSQLHMKTLTTMTMPGEYAINFSTTKLLSLSFFHVSIRELLELGRMVEWAKFSYFCSKLSESLCWVFHSVFLHLVKKHKLFRSPADSWWEKFPRKIFLVVLTDGFEQNMRKNKMRKKHGKKLHFEARREREEGRENQF